MLQNIRDRSTSWISKAIIGLIVVLLSFTGFEAILRSTSNAENAAKVNGQEIARTELEQAKNMQLRRLSQQLGQNIDLDEELVTQVALNSLINRALLLQGAQQAGFAAPQQGIDEFLLTAPEFQIDGKFSPERYDQVIGQMGYGRLQFRRMLEEDILLEQLQTGISSSALFSPQEARLLLELQEQTRDFSYTLIKPDLQAVSVTDRQVEDFYQQNLHNFMTDEQVQVEYIELSKASLQEQVQILEQELEEGYQDSIANMSEQRRAAHILLEVDDIEQDQQVLQQALDLIARLKDGETFAVLAKEYSADIGSASEGGDLGFASVGDFEPEFEQALYELDKGQISQPVRTEYGWHIIKLLDVQKAQVLSFAEMKQSLLPELRQAKAEQLFVELVQDLEGYAYEASDLQQPAHELGLQVSKSGFFSRSGGEGVLSHPKVIDAAFSQEVLEDGNNSLPIELDDETVVVLRVTDHRLPEQIELEQVQEKIRSLLIGDLAREQAREQGSALLASLQAGQSAPDESWNKLEAVSRQHNGLDNLLLRQLFKMAKPQAGELEFSGVSLQDGSYALLALSGVNQPQVEVADEEMEEIIAMLASEAGRKDFANYTRYLESKAKVERF